VSRQIGSGTTRFRISLGSEASPHHTAALALAALFCLAAMAPASAQEPLTFTDSQGRTAVFPSGLRSFADEAVGRFLGDPAPRPSDAKAASALGGPDRKAMVLGCGGSAVLAFRDNALIDIEGPDLYIFEMGADVEATSVEISTDGSSWVPIESAGGATSSVDIGPHVAPGASFHFVRLTDLKTACRSGGYPGADIDAVGAIGSVTETEPKTLTFVGKDAFGFAPLKTLVYGSPFFIEVRFVNPPEAAEHTATLGWEGGESKVTVVRTAEDPLVYRSGSIIPVQPGDGPQP
jgi:hypothetical protein